MTKRTVQFKIYRYDPDKDDKPYMQDISVELEASDKKLLDAITRLKVKDDTLSFRRSCREGVCGSDAMNINGKNGLACLTDVDSLQQPITLRPLPGLPVIRDLVVDMTQFFKQYHSITPYLINNEPAPERERLQTPEEREEVAGQAEIIIAKQRNGPIGDIDLLWQKEFTRFVNPAKRAYDDFEQFNDPNADPF